MKSWILATLLIVCILGYGASMFTLGVLIERHIDLENQTSINMQSLTWANDSNCTGSNIITNNDAKRDGSSKLKDYDGYYNTSERGYGLVFKNWVKEELLKDWNSSHEYGLCLDGYLDARTHTYYVDSSSGYSYGNENSVRISCAGLVLVHSHPNGACKPSNQDIIYFKQQVKNGVTLFLIHCDKDKFVVIDQEDLGAKYLYKITINNKEAER